MRLKFLAVAVFLALGAAPSAHAQCSGNPAAGRLCANPSASPTLPAWSTMTSVLDRNFGAPSTQGTLLNRGASSWSATATPVLGINGGVGGSITLRGATSGGATLSVAAAAGAVNFRLPDTNGTVNQVLVTDGSGNTSWSTAGAGTVNSVGLSLPAIFNVSGSPIISAGTLTATLANQSANLVWAGPTTGAAAAPTFRSLVGADLPNPSPSTLGGVQSFAGVSSQWIRQISTSGVPTASQPAFSDISGTLAASQCPNPSASSLGCIQSLAPVASRWINSISTSGVPSTSQPTFTDIAGSISPAQLPSIGNNSILGNISGGSAVPTGITASNVLDIIGSTQGQVLYRDASGWVALSPGVSGQVLTTNGAAANPAWTTVSGVGTVTSVGTGTGLTGGPITASGTISFASIADARILANISGGSAAPSANTMTAILDATLGSTQGNILYRGASNWTVLAPGTNGQVLTQGASTPSWANAGTVSNVVIAGAGLTANSGTCTITTTGTCTLTTTAATKANQQTGTSTTTVVTPAQQQSHDSATKAWAKFVGSTGAIAGTAYNISSVTRSGAGSYIINFTTAFADTNYACVGSIEDAATNGFFKTSQTGQTTTAQPAFTLNLTPATYDPAFVTVACYGRQ